MMPRRSQRYGRRDARGFTLIEILVALALISGLLLVLFSGVSLGVTAMTRLDDQVARIEARRNLDFALRREIAAAYPASDGPMTAATFVGHATAVSFLSLAGGAAPSYARVWLMIENAPGEHGGRNLVLMRRPQAPGQWFGFERLVLARDVTRFRLDYFGATTPADPRAWHTSWEGYRAPPELIRISLALDSDGGYPWPDEVVRVWAGVAP
jgi:general secretion pathway protein J